MSDAVRLGSGHTGRRIRLLAVTTFAALCGVALAILVLVAMSRPTMRTRVDLTHGNRASLSERTVAALRALPEGSELAVFLLPEEEAFVFNGSVVYPNAFFRLRALVEDARVRAGGTLTTEVFDSGSSLVAISDARERLERQPGVTLVLSAGDLRKTLRFDELFQVAQPRDDGTPARVLGERVDQALGDAALALGTGDPPTIAIVTGSGQGALDDVNGLGQFADLLRRQSWQPMEISGPGSAGDAQALLIPGQQSPFSPADLQALRAWMDAGRPLLVALGPFATPQVVEQWNELLAERGIRFDDGLLCQPVRQNNLVPAEGTEYSAQLEIQPAQLAAMHAATTRLAASSRVSLLGGVRPLALESGTNDWTQERLIRSAESAWIDDPRGMAFLFDGAETRGIRSISIASERWSATAEGGLGRTIALGTGQAFRGGELALAQDLLLGSVRWLMEEEEAGGLVGVQELPFRPSAAARARIQNLAIYGIPGVTLLIGLWVWWRRRR